jgi:hypothetical protein
MEKILLINGISPYLYALILFLTPQDVQIRLDKILLSVFLIQLLMTVILSLASRDKAKVAKITMINKFVQIPYYILFFIFAVAGVVFGMSLMGIGILFIPIFIAIDFGVFLTTLIPEEICTIKLKATGRISTGRFILYLIGNTFYVIDIVLSVLIHKEYARVLECKGASE